MKQTALKRRDFFIYNFPLDFSGPGVQLVSSQNLLSTGDYELFSINDNHPNEFLYQIRDTSENRGLFSQQLPISSMGGTGEYTYDLPVSYRFMNNRTISIEATNGTVGGANNGVLTMIGCHYTDLAPQEFRETYYEGERSDIFMRETRGRFFAYGIEIKFNTGNNQVVSDAINIFNEAAFEAYYITKSHDKTKPFTVQIEDYASNRTLFRDDTPSNNVMGNGQRPFVMPVTRIFPAKGSIAITAINGPTSGIHTGYIVFHGANLKRGDILGA